MAAIAHHFEQAETALRSGRGKEALRCLLAAWRIGRHPALADAIAALSERFEVPPLPKSRTQKQQVLDWIARARLRHPHDLRMLREVFIEYFAHNRKAHVCAMLDELCERGDDPRLSALALTLMQFRLEDGSARGKIWTRVVRLLLVCRDPRSRASVAALSELPVTDYWRRMQLATLPAILARLDKQLAHVEQVELDEDTRSRCDELTDLARTVHLGEEPDVEQEGAQADVLLEAVFASPNDDGLRMVLADALLDRDDPRGELISLQLSASRTTRKSVARQRALIREHGLAWAGGLRRILKRRDLMFSRGFVASCHLNVMKAAHLAAERGHPEWATVERIVFDVSVNRARAVLSPRMTSIRALIDVPSDDVRQVIQLFSDSELRELALAERHPPQLSTLVDGRFPKLETLTLFDPNRSTLRAVGESALGARLRTLVMQSWHPQWKHFARDFPAPRVVVSAECGWCLRERTDDGDRFQARFQRVSGHVLRPLFDQIDWSRTQELVIELPIPGKSERARFEAELLGWLGDIPIEPRFKAVNRQARPPWAYFPDGV